ncbi:MAG TPA: diaminopimelate dehydrogenase [Bacteroidales bacterium]|nr:diaminopimelate dehydrogenase [Bacteroidales bacterium]
MKKIKIGIVGYGNLGRGVEAAIRQNPDTELAAVFTRRNPSDLKLFTKNVPVEKYSHASLYEGKIDVMILCGGSATDLEIQTPEMARMFNTIDSFDTHAKINNYFRIVNDWALPTRHVSIISVGWDPGMFSVNRLYSNCILPGGKDYTFWGPGVSQGHSDAIRRIKGVKNAKQYTLPVKDAVESVRKGENPDLATRQKHTRLCYVVAEEGADLNKIENEIVTMPNYFSDYDTTVKFISEKEFERDHQKLPHGGFVMRSGSTGINNEEKQIIEYSLKLDSNPGFTSCVLVAYARAAWRLSTEGNFGAKTVFDIAPSLLSPLSGEELRAKFL